MNSIHARGLVALIAASAALFSASSASAAQFLSTSSPVTLYGQDSGNHVFTVDGQAVTCTSASFEKTALATPANTIWGVSAAYSNCTAFGFYPATVNMGNCTYELLQPNSTLEGNVSLRCNVNPITIKVTSFGGTECRVTIGEFGNTNLSKISYANHNPTAGKVLATATVTNIMVTKLTDNFLCPLSGVGTVNNGTYNGPTPVEGAGGVVLWVG